MNERARFLVVTSELPDPPYPKTTKSGSFAFDLEMDRVVQSDTWALASPEIRPWLLMCWSMSWLQYPCGTWPNNDDVIATRLGCERKWFAVHRDEIMRGWVLHSDGRMYHPVVTEKVLGFMSTRARWRKSSEKYKATANQGVTEKVSDDSVMTPRVLRTESSPSYSSSPSVSSSKDTHASHESAKPSGSTRAKPPCPHEKILALWQEILPELPQPKGVEHWTEARKSQLRARWNDQLPDLDTWRQMMLDIRGSPFLMGQRQSPGRKPFRCDLFWITTPERLLRLQEGRYDG